MDRFGYVLSVMSSDHPGIVAGVSSAVAALNGNINSCSQTVLGGYFTFITLIDLPCDYEPEQLVGELRRFEGWGPDYHVIVRRRDDALPDAADTVDTESTYVITAFGKDRKGIVMQFSRFLAGHDINITDLYGDRKGDDFMLVAQLTIPKTVNIAHLKDDLEETGKEFGFTIRLQHNNIFIATNQLRIDN